MVRLTSFVYNEYSADYLYKRNIRLDWDLNRRRGKWHTWLVKAECQTVFSIITENWQWTFEPLFYENDLENSLTKMSESFTEILCSKIIGKIKIRNQPLWINKVDYVS